MDRRALQGKGSAEVIKLIRSLAIKESALRNFLLVTLMRQRQHLAGEMRSLKRETFFFSFSLLKNQFFHSILNQGLNLLSRIKPNLNEQIRNFSSGM